MARGRLDLEPDEPDGAAADAGHGRGLYHFHPTGLAPAWRRSRPVRRSVGRALMLCGGTAMAGFGSLGFSSNPGMASLGRVCAVGIGANMIISVFLLPAWWTKLNPNAECRMPKSENGDSSSCTMPAETELSKFEVQSSRFKVSSPNLNPQPSTFNTSSFYRAGLWRFGLAVVRVLPAGLVKGFFRNRGRVLFPFPTTAPRGGGAKFSARLCRRPCRC